MDMYWVLLITEDICGLPTVICSYLVKKQLIIENVDVVQPVGKSQSGNAVRSKIENTDRNNFWLNHETYPQIGCVNCHKNVTKTAAPSGLVGKAIS